MMDTIPRGHLGEALLLELSPPSPALTGRFCSPKSDHMGVVSICRGFPDGQQNHGLESEGASSRAWKACDLTSGCVLCRSGTPPKAVGTRPRQPPQALEEMQRPARQAH